MNVTTINILDELLTLFDNNHKHSALYKQMVIKLFDRSCETHLLYKNRDKLSIKPFKDFINKMDNPSKDFQCVYPTPTSINAKSTDCCLK